MKRRVLVWFRNDLRTHDCAPLYEAARLAQSRPNTNNHKHDVEVIPVYCFDPRQYGTTDQVFYQSGFGAQKTGYLRAKFILESVVALKEQLQTLGSDLLICIGQPEDILPQLLPAHHQRGEPKPLILASGEVAPEEQLVERAVKKAIRSQGGILNLYWTNSLYDHTEVLNQFGGVELGKYPTVFTKFKNKVERNCRIPAPLPPPSRNSFPFPADIDAHARTFIPTIDDLPWSTPPEVPSAPVTDSAFPWTGGEITGLQRVEHYLFDTDAVATYFDTRNQMLGTEYSTKFSPWLSVGALSSRYVHARIQAYESARVSNKSTYWVTFELTWRDFFWYLTYCHGAQLFQQEGLLTDGGEWSQDMDVFHQWKTGTLGVPFVDANMRELLQTGWMSNRGRQNVASYLIHNLGIDWRLGAEHFEECLLDYDPASNWGNWVAAAGLTGGRTNRFNIPKQAKVYDPHGDYVRAWLPERHSGRSIRKSTVPTAPASSLNGKHKKYKRKKRIRKQRRHHQKGVEHYMSMV